jgi:predicted permease
MVPPQDLLFNFPGGSMKTLIHDVRYGWRQLRKTPAFTITAVLTLALGIGANTAVYTLVHEVLLKSLPVENPGGLYRLGDAYNCCIEGDMMENWTMFSFPAYEYLRDHTPEFTAMAASQTGRPDLSVRRQGAQEAQSFNGELVTGNYFSTLGVRAAAGRLISPQDDQIGAPAVAVISYKAWQEKYGGDPSLVGSSLSINGIPSTLIGVAGPGFYGDRRESDPPDFWMQLSLEPVLNRENSIIRSPSTSWLYVFGRLKPGSRPEQVSAHVTSEMQTFIEEQAHYIPTPKPEDIKKQQVKVASAAGGVNAMEDEYRKGLYILLGAAGVILLIACANVANLLLARGAATRFRTSLQLAVGAPRVRIIRGKLTESLLLSLLGGAAGLLLAYYASKAIVLLAFRGADFVPISASPSLPVLAFTFAVALLTGIIFGIAPAWVASRADPADALRGAVRSTRDSAGTGQKSLVVVQAALSLALLTVAGLLTKSLSNLQNQQFGFERQGRLLVQINPATAGYTQERLLGLYQTLEDRFQHMPGVISESLALYTAQQGNNWGEGIHILGKPDIPHSGSSWDRVSTHYFETIGTPIVRGRGFTERDTATSQRVTVVSEAFVQKFFPNTSPIGQHFGKGDVSHAGDYEIVGVSKDAKYGNASGQPRVMFFIPLVQTMHYSEKMDEVVETASMYMDTIALHVTGNPRNFESQVRRTLAEIDPNLTPLTMRTFDDLIQIRTNNNTLIARLSAIFGLLALLLASIGLYGLTAYQVTQRTGEIGIRMALGANRVNIIKLVLRGAFLLVAIGLAAGAVLALVGGKVLASQLFGVTAFEPLILTAAVLALGFCALLASVLPARRAAGVDPMRALRTE